MKTNQQSDYYGFPQINIMNNVRRTIVRLHDKVYGRARSRRFLLDMMPKHSVCAEIGVWKGEFSAEIFDVVHPKEVHLIDPWLYFENFGKRLYGGKEAKNQKDMDAIYDDVQRKVGHREGAVIHRSLSEDAVQKFTNKSLDWVYIDGCHYYDFVKKDLALYYEKVKEGGYITGDDYYWTSSELNGLFPIKKAVDEFVAKKNLVLSVKNGQFIIQK